MAEHKQFPGWVQNALGVALGTAILGIGFAAWNDRALDARRDERLHHLETGFTEFSKPGKRYVKSDGDRDRSTTQRRIAEVKATLRELKTEFNQFRNGPSRADREIKLLDAKIDTCHDITHTNNVHWIDTTVKINEVAAKLEAFKHTLYPRPDVLQHVMYPGPNGYGNPGKQ